MGISSVDLDKIFLPFQQVGSANHHIEGTGLGLSITKKLVETMAGELNVESVIDKGSKFWFTLDLPEVSVLTLHGQIEKPKIIGYKLKKYLESQQTPIKILVIDDKAENRSVLVNLLTPLGFEVSEARNGQEGLNTARKLRPSLIFLDLVMPIMNGFETIQQIRNNPLFDKTIVIAVSASVFDYYQYQSLRAGCNGFIAKPVHLEELLNCLEKQLKIEWFYEEKQQQSLIETDLSHGYKETLLTGPTPEQATILYKLAKRGDINGIIAFAEQLAHIDEKLVPFANKIIELAENLQKKEIHDLTKSFMDTVQ
jgi:CheY-like chemotaxis protein